MIEQFYSLKNSLQKTLINQKFQTCLHDSDFLLIKEIFEVMKPIHLIIEVLCHKNFNLLTADIDLKILLHELSEKKEKSKFA